MSSRPLRFLLLGLDPELSTALQGSLCAHGDCQSLDTLQTFRLAAQNTAWQVPHVIFLPLELITEDLFEKNLPKRAENRRALFIAVLQRTEDLEKVRGWIGKGIHGYICHEEPGLFHLSADLMPNIARHALKGDVTDHSDIEEKLKTAIQNQLRDEHRLRETLTALERVHKKLRLTHEQLVQAEKMKSLGRLATSVAHEVKNPLAILLQGVDFLRRSIRTSDADVSQVLEDMSLAVRRADEIIRGLLEYASPSEIKMDLVNIHDTLEDALSLTRHLLSKNQVQVHKSYGVLQPGLLADKMRLQQIWINLISNAVNAMPQGGQLRIVTSETSDSQDKTGFWVAFEDTGPGIPEELQRKILDPFMTTRRNEGGTGLGLSIAQTLAEVHGGYLEIGNLSPKGAFVRVFLPERPE